MKKIAQGAEAVLYRDGSFLIKSRIPKSYRLKEIDEQLRKARTRKEAKILTSLPVPCPKLVHVDDKQMRLEMTFLDGPRLADVLEKEDFVSLSREIGAKVKKMHVKNIIHGDLTTSNMIHLDEIYFIDFGLSYISTTSEDKAVDLHLLRQALESKHHKIWKECFNEIKKAYGDKKVLKRLDKVEARGRHKNK